MSNGKRHYERTTTRPLITFMDRNNLSQTQVANKLGVTGSSVSAWISAGNMPVMAAQAIRGLEKTFKESSRKVLICETDREMTDEIKRLLAALDISLVNTISVTELVGGKNGG
jgi:predicted transcriptional regulator